MRVEAEGSHNIKITQLKMEERMELVTLLDSAIGPHISPQDHKYFWVIEK
ncbi:MAG: hypothetical protein INQ03_04910 [Candidatus Heimdallarchaeota archaeon]|nr:hypothetical protein [Candidatus Heimdallarchaeota archaeon]